MQASPQIAPPVQLARPGCLVWYAGDPCDQQIHDQQQQITEQQVQLRTLQTRIDSKTMEALRSEARSQAFVDGIGVIIGIGLAFLLVVAAFRKLSHHESTDSEHHRAASAQSGW